MARKKTGKAVRPPDDGEPVLPAVNRAIDDPIDGQPAVPFTVACIGASAGGLAAISQLLRALPTDTGMAFVVVQHLEPSHESMLSGILSRNTRMPVTQVGHGDTVEPNHVYVIPPGKNMVVDGNRLQLAPRTETRGQHRPIDHFMRSLAESQADRSIGIILSGTANDGTQGLEEIKAAGGITFAQDDTAEHGGMPRSAIAAGCVDFVLPPDGIGRELARIARHPYVQPARIELPKALPDSAAILRILEILRQNTGVDFANYKRNTMHRRIARRMVLHRLDSLGEYVTRLVNDPGEVEALYHDILINVTSFFRNPEAFEALKSQVFPRLTGSKSRHEPVRVWALGCSTGEEAYSIAMAYSEYAEAANCRVPMQVFATDLNGAGIDKARTGIYPRGIAQDLTPERLRRFFVEIDGSYRIAKPIRDMVVFARQNALADPPFSHMGLVACRNMLIYLEPILQQRLIPLLHYALQPTGFLWLGHSETINSYRDLFEISDSQHKIFLRKPGPSRTRVGVPLGPYTSPPTAVPANTRAATPRQEIADPQKEAERLLLARYAPPGVVVDRELNVLQFRGDTGPYLAPPPGRPNLNLLKMLREGLLAPVRAALRKVQKEGGTVREEGLRVRSNGGYRAVSIVVLPVRGVNVMEGTCLLLFEEPARQAEARAREAEAQARAAAAETAPAPERKGADREIARLQEEVTEMREYLQTVTEEHETTTEELQSANEEVQSANEELQSTNEELETSREEIQSSNEELATVNDELQRRNEDLQHANNDLINLVASVQMPIVILGADLRIRRFTPSAEKMLNLIPADVGRPLADIRLKFAIPDLEKLLIEVIESVSSRELEVQDAQGRWYLLRIRPYKTLENKIDGAVLVLVDVDTIKRAEQDLRDSDQRKNDFLAMLSHELRTPLAALHSAAEVISAPEATGDAQDQARSVLQRQTRNMARMVDDLLDMARVSRGTIALRQAPVDLVAALRHAINATQHERTPIEQQLTLDLPAKPVGIMGDAMRLDQMFANLLTNASKFTPREGHLWLSLSTAPGAPGVRGHAVVRLRDDGVGIEAEALPHVFDLFSAIGRAPAHARQGLGLGLTLVRRLAELHGGTIEAKSAGTGLGSEFVLRLPLLAPDQQATLAAPPSIAPAPPTVTPRRVLVVDDSIDAARIMRVMLELDGHTVEIAHDGPAAIDRARAFRPEVVLLDLGLPGMDGFEIARRLRQEPGLEGLALVALSGYGRDEDLKRTRASGFNRHLVKPVERKVLQQVLAEVVG